MFTAELSAHFKSFRMLHFTVSSPLISYNLTKAKIAKYSKIKIYNADWGQVNFKCQTVSFLWKYATVKQCNSEEYIRWIDILSGQSQSLLRSTLLTTKSSGQLRDLLPLLLLSLSLSLATHMTAIQLSHFSISLLCVYLSISFHSTIYPVRSTFNIKNCNRLKCKVLPFSVLILNPFDFPSSLFDRRDRTLSVYIGNDRAIG